MDSDSKTITDKKPAKGRFMYFIRQALIIWFCLLCAFAFSGIPFLSDLTFVSATFWYIVLPLCVLITFLIFKKYFTSGSRYEKGIAIAALVSCAVLLVRTAAFEITKEPVQEVRYAELVTEEDLQNMSGEKGQLLAGAAKGNITPSTELYPMPLLSVLKFRDIRDEVYARVLSLSDGEQKYLYIALDMTLVPKADETLDFISNETGIPRENILITATHTHGTSPVSLTDFLNPFDTMKNNIWYKQVMNTLLETIAEAQKGMVPAKYGYGEGESYVNVNRDILVGDQSILGTNVDGYSDKTIRMVRIDDLSGKNIALLVNYACHGTVMNGAIYGIGTSFTGDLPGQSALKVEKDLDGGICLWSAGAAGDQNPIICAQGEQLDDSGEAHHYFLGRKASSHVLDTLSSAHAQNILDAYEDIEAAERDSLITTKSASVDIETEDEVGSITYELRVFTLGSIAFEAVDAEIVSSVGKSIREASPYEHTILMTLANGYKGYVPDEWEYDHDAFENSYNLKRGAGEAGLVAGFEALFDQDER